MVEYIERFGVYRKSHELFISLPVIARNRVLLRLWGFLHALCLVEMTTKKTTSSRVPFSVKKERHLERSPVIQSVAKHVIQRAYNARRNSWEGTAYTPRRDDIQRLALMIYSHK